jgi:hypothetical protein
MEGVKKRREGRDRGWEKWKERERSGGEGPHSIFLPEGSIGCLAATDTVTDMN